MGTAISSTMGSVMDENMKKQQQFMLENQQTMMERQLVMQVSVYFWKIPQKGLKFDGNVCMCLYDAYNNCNSIVCQVSRFISVSAYGAWRILDRWI